MQQKSASSQIDGLLSGTAQKLKSECHDELSGKKSAMRSAIYDTSRATRATTISGIPDR